VFDVAGEENRLKQLLIHIPGSSFVQYCLDAHDYACSAIALQSGFRVIMIEPRIAQAPHQVNDVAGVVRSLIACSHQWKVKPAGVVLSGYSSGANLALSAWLDLRDQGFSDLDAITHLILLSGTYDLTMSAADASQQLYTQRYRSYEEHDIFVDTIFDRMYDIYLPQGMKRDHPFVSPYFRDLTGLPAVDLVVTEYDGVRHQTHQLADKLAYNQQVHQLTIVPGKTHSFFIAEALMHCGVDPADLVVSLLAQRAAVMPSGV
jgi:acetyl esterase